VVLEKANIPKYVSGLARRLRTNSTGAKAILREALRNRKLAGAKFRRQHPLGRYIADFYCHESLLVVELDGSVYDDLDQAGYDVVQQKEIEERGLTVLRLKNEEVMRSLSTTLEIIAEVLKTR
jgi:very-short-patch-repair endonuclease